MKKIQIEKEVSDKLEAQSVIHNRSKASIALEACEKIFGQGVPHRSR